MAKPRTIKEPTITFCINLPVRQMEELRHLAKEKRYTAIGPLVRLAVEEFLTKQSVESACDTHTHTQWEQKIMTITSHMPRSALERKRKENTAQAE